MLCYLFNGMILNLLIGTSINKAGNIVKLTLIHFLLEALSVLMGKMALFPSL